MPPIPVGGGLVASFGSARRRSPPGFVTSEFGLAGKWLELFKEVAPRVAHVAACVTLPFPRRIALFGSMQSVAPSLGVRLPPDRRARCRRYDAASLHSHQAEPNGGLIAPTGARAFLHRELIVALAARHHLPAVYAYRSHVISGGLISYAADRVDQFGVPHVDRILKARPADLPVQAPTKYELVINLKTAKAPGRGTPPTVLATR